MTQTPQDPRFDQRVRASFERQAVMATLGATLARVAPGEVVIEVPFRPEFTQQHGFLHAGIVTSVMDSACGYAALSLMEPGTGVLSIEFKVNLVAPARGNLFRASGRVVRAGRTVTVALAEFRVADAAGEEQPASPPDTIDGLIAIMTGTMMTVRDRPALID
jgi:uncharacterized protein (TIGR00369 family)